MVPFKLGRGVWIIVNKKLAGRSDLVIPAFFLGKGEWGRVEGGVPLLSIFLFLHHTMVIDNILVKII